MARFEKTFYKCDLCGVEMDEPYNGGEDGTFQIVATEDYAVAGNTLSWKDLCASCNGFVGRYISDIKAHNKAFRDAQKAQNQ